MCCWHWPSSAWPWSRCISFVRAGSRDVEGADGTDDLIRKLSRIQTYAAGLPGLIDSARVAAPKAVTPTDNSGTLRVALGPDGLPKSFRVDQKWRRRIVPER